MKEFDWRAWHDENERRIADIQRRMQVASKRLDLLEYFKKQEVRA